jgi:uncharacterized damage-inducible protein DinB
MLSQILEEIFIRDLAILREEILRYDDEESLWIVDGEIANSGGNLALHIAGNLRHFIGAVLGGDGYVRNRESEFSARAVPREKIIAEIDAAAAAIRVVMPGLNKEILEETYPIEVFGRPMTNAFFLTHLATHLNYHLGQINYHRRLTANRKM